MEKIEMIYRGENGKKYHSNKHFLSDEEKELMAISRHPKFLKYINSETKLLEYGVGGGFNINKLKCKEKHGFDIANSLQEQIEKLGIKFINNEDEIENNYYDVIICHHVLEHVPNPLNTISIIKSKLKKDGTLILVVPQESPKKYSKYNEKNIDFHLYSWNVQTFTHLAKESGFTPIETKVLSCGYDRFINNLIYKYKLPRFTFNVLFYFSNLFLPEKEIFLVLKNK